VSRPFAARAKTAADKRLTADANPNSSRGEDGKIAYAVYRGESSLYATLLIAPSLPKLFEELFGKEIWVAACRTATRSTSFPPGPTFSRNSPPTLAERYTTDAFAASCEVFSLKAGEEPRVVASFAGEE
jgi:hypothetical protein